jgi:hypothetical protein
MPLNGKVLRRRELNNRETQTTTQFYKNGKQTLTRQDLNNLLARIREKGQERYDNFDVKLIRVLNGANWVSFTDDDALESYYNGKVSDAEKFYEFSQVQITSIFS